MRSYTHVSPSSIWQSGSRSAFRRALWLFGFIGLSLWSSPLAAAEPLTITTTVNRVATNEKGEETLIPGDRAEPLEILLYRAVYENTTQGTLGAVAAVLPVPPGLGYLTGTAKPAATEASVDGKTYFPLTKLPEGVTPADFRALRWAPRDLARGEKFTVELRARVAGRTSVGS